MQVNGGVASVASAKLDHLPVRLKHLLFKHRPFAQDMLLVFPWWF